MGTDVEFYCKVMLMDPVEGRITSVDFIKGLMITLMVTFHLPLSGYVVDATPYVYAFHMPVFLVLSGFFLKVDEIIRLTVRGLLELQFLM